MEGPATGPGVTPETSYGRELRTARHRDLAVERREHRGGPAGGGEGSSEAVRSPLSARSLASAIGSLSGSASRTTGTPGGAGRRPSRCCPTWRRRTRAATASISAAVSQVQCQEDGGARTQRDRDQHARPAECHHEDGQQHPDEPGRGERRDPPDDDRTYADRIVRGQALDDLREGKCLLGTDLDVVPGGRLRPRRSVSVTCDAGAVRVHVIAGGGPRNTRSSAGRQIGVLRQWPDHHRQVLTVRAGGRRTVRAGQRSAASSPAVTVSGNGAGCM